MQAKLTVCAEIEKPIDAASAMFLGCVAYLLKLGVTRFELNGDGDVMMSGQGKTTCITPADLPDISQMLPRVEAMG